MKISKLICLGIFISFLSCDTKDFIKSDCAIYLIDNLDTWESEYGVAMIQPDSEGNDQSLEACIQRRNLTIAYIDRLEGAQATLLANDGCSEEEKFDLNSRIGDRITDLNEDITNIWSRCEEIFGED